MDAQFDVNSLTEFLKAFNVLTKMRTGLLDRSLHEVCFSPGDLPPFCQALRESPQADMMCEMCDRTAYETCRKTSSIYCYSCHAGLTEAFAPIVYNNCVVGFMFIGAVLQYPDLKTGWNTVRERCSQYGVDMSTLRRAFFETYQDVTTRENMNAALRFMEAFLIYVRNSYANNRNASSLRAQIEDYIHDHINEKLTCEILCEKLRVSKSRMYRLFSQEYGTTISRYIGECRINLSKKLLRESDLTIGEIACQIGIPDYNYFTKVFGKVIGMSPSMYRKTIVK